VRSFAQLEAAMNCTERIFFYIDNVPQEADAKSANPPPAAWPDKGKIELKNLRMKYRDDTPVVLKGLDLTFEGGERVGIVGRTGSGKSSLLLCLLRLVEPEKAEKGEKPIAIDGVDVTQIGLAELRRKIAIIPQNPTLFSGTIRSNLDPFDEYVYT
jgi:ATP-binding cassette subfamily C (CFTR/MRP) protein 1